MHVELSGCRLGPSTRPNQSPPRALMLSNREKPRPIQIVTSAKKYEDVKVGGLRTVRSASSAVAKKTEYTI